MWLKEFVNEIFSDEKSLLLERYKAAKFSFIAASFLFFINFYLVWARFSLEIFSSTLPIIYIILLLSMVLYAYYFIKKSLFWKISSHFFIIIFIIILLFFTLLLFPSVIRWGLSTVISV